LCATRYADPRRTRAETEHARSRRAENFDGDVIFLRAQALERLADRFVNGCAGYFD
jgi:hypothetical protein